MTLHIFGEFDDHLMVIINLLVHGGIMSLYEGLAIKVINKITLEDFMDDHRNSLAC